MIKFLITAITFLLFFLAYYIANGPFWSGVSPMEKGKRKIYNTTLNSELTRSIRILAARMGKRQNELIEEAIRDLLDKYSQDNDRFVLSPSGV